MRARGPSPLSSLLLAASVMLLASTGAADAILPPPENCPRGSLGQSSHMGPVCRATTCVTDADCEKQRSWQDQKRGRKITCEDNVTVCVEQRESNSWRNPSAPKIIVPVAAGSCDEGGTCAAPAMCETARRCVMEDVPASTSPGDKQGGASGGKKPGSAPPAPGGSSAKGGSGGGCACEMVGGGEPAAAIAMVLVGIVLLGARISRARGRSRLDA